MNPYVRIAIAAMAAVYLTPPIVNRFVGPEVDVVTTGTNGSSAISNAPASDVIRNDVIIGGVTGLVTAAVYVVLGMAGGAAS